MTRGAWSQTFPEADLPAQIAFYRLQQERFRTTPSYEDDVRALEAVRLQR